MGEINCSVTIMPIYRGSIWFIRRDKGDSFEGLLVAPGGKVKTTDAVELIEGVSYYSVEYAAYRELLEETGIRILLTQLKYFCSLTLPGSSRVVISLYCLLREDQFPAEYCNLVLLDYPSIVLREDFAPGMKVEALKLLKHLGLDKEEVQA